jgi:hypothetical protein
LFNCRADLHLKLPLLSHTTDLVEEPSSSDEATADAVFTIESI